MFEKKYESRFSDIDKNRCFKTGAVMNLLQDISFAHATYAGIDEERLCEYGTALLLSGWRVKFLNKLLDPDVVVKTGIMNVGRCEAASSLKRGFIWNSEMLMMLFVPLHM